MTPIDEAALKAGISEPVASELPLDVDGLFMHLKILGLDNERLCKQALRIAIASRSQPVAVVPAEQAEDSAMRKDAMRWQYVKGIARHESSWRGRTWTFDLASNSANLDAATDAAIAAIGRNREAGGS